MTAAPALVEIVSRGAVTPLPTESAGRGDFVVADWVRVRFGSYLIEIEPGFTTDGASIPWYGRWWFDPWGRRAIAAIVHDYLIKLRNLPKWQIDMIFYWLLKAEGSPDFEATVMYLAVRTRP